MGFVRCAMCHGRIFLDRDVVRGKCDDKLAVWITHVFGRR